MVGKQDLKKKIWILGVFALQLFCFACKMKNIIIFKICKVHSWDYFRLRLCNCLSVVNFDTKPELENNAL